MPIYVTDPETNVRLSYYGDRSPSLELANEVIGTAIINEAQRLFDGSYRQDKLGRDLDPYNVAKNLEKGTALQLRVPVENIDATSGLGDFERAKLGLRPTKGQKLEYLRSKYGFDNVQAVPVNGKYRLLLKTEGEGKNAKYKFVNEEGLDFGDITEFGASAAIPIVVAGAVAIKAPQLIAPLATTGWGSSAGLGLLSGASYFGSASLQDAVVAAIDETEIDKSEIFKRRGTEAGLALFPEIAMIRGGQWLTGFAGSGADDLAKALRRDIGKLNNAFDAQLKAGAGGLSSRLAAETERKATANSAALRKLYQENIDQLYVMANSLNKGSAEPIEAVVERARDSITQRLTKLEDGVRAFDSELADSVQSILQTRLKKLGGSERMYLRGPVGKQVKDGLQSSYNAAYKEKTKRFKEIAKIADEEAIVYDVDEVLKAMRRAIEKGGAGLDEIDLDAARSFASAMERTGINDELILKALKEDLPFDFFGADLTKFKTMSYEQLDKIIRRYAERADFGDPLKATKSSAGFARIMRKELTAVRDKALGGTETKKALDRANKFYRTEYGKFLRADVKPFIKPDFGSGYGPTGGKQFKIMGDVAATNRLFSSADAVKGVIDALPKISASGGLTQSKAIELFRKAYMGEVGLQGTVKLGKGFKMKELNTDIMSRLYPRNWESKIKAFERLNELAQKSGKVLEIDDMVFREILTAGTPSQVRAAEDAAKASVKAAENLATVQQNKLFQSIIKREGVLSVEDAMEAVGSLLNYSSKDISKFKQIVMESSGESGLNTLRNKLSNDILESARPTKANYPVTTQGKPLFDSDILLDKLSNNSIRKVAKEILGEDWIENMEAIARVAKYSTAEAKRFPGLRPVVSPGSGGMQTTFVATDLPADVGRYFYGKFATTPGLKNFLSRKSPDEAAAAFRQILPYYMASAQGMESLLLQMRDDPTLAKYIQDELANLGNYSMMGTNQINQAVEQSTAPANR